MFIKTCIRIAPVLLRNINKNRVPLVANAKTVFGKECAGCFFIQNIPTVRYSSTVSKNTGNNERQRVYNGSLATQIKTIKWFSLSTSVLGLIAQPIIYNEVASTKSLPLVIGVCTFVGFFTFITPFLLHFVTKKYITHLDYKASTDTYVASTVNFFCRTKELEFSPSDVRIPDVPGMFTTFVAKDTALFLEPRFFADLTHYAKIMGYDKPLDLKLYETSPTEKK